MKPAAWKLSPGAVPAWGSSLIRLGPVFALLAGLMGVPSARAAPADETFGPGKVSCQILVGDQADCLLSSSRITVGGNNEASFSLAELAPGERKLFTKWCLNPSDECIVTFQGHRQFPQGTRLSSVTSLVWRRPRPPRDQAAAAP